MKMKQSVSKKEYYEGVKKIFEDALDILKKKSHDYSGDTNPFKNFEISSEVSGVDVPTTILIRLSDKLSRIGTLLHNNAMVADEKIEDTIKDAINYLAILLMYLRRYE